MFQSALTGPAKVVQCPRGFASYGFKAGENLCALTGYIPFPRIGGDSERRVAKAHKEHRITQESIRKHAELICEIADGIRAIETETVKKYSVAFHEIRKLNRQVNQTAERLCREEAENPDDANPRLVTIWKSAELMSKQFEIMELLANESLAELPLKSIIEPYKLFDKCIRVYSASTSSDRFKLFCKPKFHPRVLVCDKTFPIIPTVLIQNAIKYSIPDSEIRVMFEEDAKMCKVSVVSLSKGNQRLNDRIFNRGVRLDTSVDGSGNGLYLAQLVAKQHNTRILVDSYEHGSETIRHVFSIYFDIHD